MRTALRVVVILVVLSVVLRTWARYSLADLPDGSRAKALFYSHPQAVTVWETEIEDGTRKTPAHGSFAGAESRKMKLRVWQSEAALGPLLVYSHGFGGNRDDIDALLRQVATLGYTIVAPSFPATSTFTSGGPFLPDVVNQPADQRFVIDRVLEWNKTQGHALFQRIDPERIGAVGVSLGGLTTYLMLFDPVRQDPRLKAGVSIAGLHAMFTRDYFTRKLPFLELAGTKDAVVPFADNGANVPAQIPGAILVTIDNGTHIGFVDTSPTIRFLAHPDSLACWFVMRNIDRKAKGSWPEGLGATPGVVQPEAHACEERLMSGPTRDPREQLRVTALAVSAFLQSQFAADAATRSESDAYLRRELATEMQGVTVTSSSLD